MTHIYRDFYCDSDGIQITLYKKRITKDDSRAKEENIGKEKYVAVGYYTDLFNTIAAVIRQTQRDVLVNEESEELISAVNRCADMIKEIKDTLKSSRITERLLTEEQ